jgi:O-antigen/teichoic acid export membrane protein
MLTLLQFVRREGEPPESVLRSCQALVLTQGTAFGLVGIGLAVGLLRGLPVTAVVMLTANELLVLPLVEFVAMSMQATKSFVSATRVRMVPGAVKVLVLLALAVVDHVTLSAIAYSYVAANIVLATLFLRWMRHKHHLPVTPGHIVGKHVRTGFTYATGMFALGMQNDGDKTVLAADKLEYAGGLYSAAYRFVQLGLIPVGALIGASHTRFLDHDPNQRNQHLRRAAKFSLPVLAYSAVFGVGMWFAAPIVTSVMNSEYRESATIMRYLIPLVPLRGLSMFPINGLMGLGHTAARTVLLIVSALVAFGAYIVLIPRYTWKGAVGGTIISESFMAVAAWSLLFFYQRRHNAGLPIAAPISL